MDRCHLGERHVSILFARKPLTQALSGCHDITGSGYCQVVRVYCKNARDRFPDAFGLFELHRLSPPPTTAQKSNHDHVAITSFDMTSKCVLLSKPAQEPKRKPSFLRPPWQHTRRRWTGSLCTCESLVKRMTTATLPAAWHLSPSSQMRQSPSGQPSTVADRNLLGVPGLPEKTWPPPRYSAKHFAAFSD